MKIIFIHFSDIQLFNQEQHPLNKPKKILWRPTMLEKRKKETESNNKWIEKKLPQVGELSKIDPWWGLVAVVLAIILLLIFLKPDPYLRMFVYLKDGIWVTIYVTVISFALILVFGLIGGLGRVSKNKVFHGIISVYVEVIRGIPLMVQLLMWYFAFPAIVMNLGNKWNIDWMKHYLANPLSMAVFGISFCYAAYMSEIVRAGIESLPAGQMEAARSLGMNSSQAMFYVILPQAYKTIMPAIGNEFISLLKDSSLVSTVAIMDLTRRGREFMSSTFLPIETWTMVALLYLLMTLLSARLMNMIEKKTKMVK